MSKYKIGDMVFVPNAFDWVWLSCMTTIKEVTNIDGKDIYYADCPHNNLFNNEPSKVKEFRFEEKEIFLNKSDCDEYIRNYYYSGLCDGCYYENKCGNIWRCKDCSHCIKCENPDITKYNTYRCTKTNILIGVQYSAFSEICKYYKPTLTQNKREYVSWENYEDILRNCEFNKTCKLHSKSCHKTCTYEWYMNEIMVIPYSFVFKGRDVKAVRIRRKQWIEQNFLHLDEGIIECTGVDFVYERNKRGLQKKECYPLTEWFGENVKIDFVKGEMAIVL